MAHRRPERRSVTDSYTDPTIVRIRLDRTPRHETAWRGAGSSTGLNTTRAFELMRRTHRELGPFDSARFRWTWWSPMGLWPIMD